MQPFVLLFGYPVPLSDLIFILTIGVWVLGLAIRTTSSFRWHGFFWLLLLYAAAMLVSAIFSVDPKSSFIKFAGEIYLLSLPVLTFNIIKDENRLKLTVYTWLAATLVCAVVGIITLVLFYVDRTNWLLSFTLFQFGTLPPGDYPRLRSTFLNGNMLCNYLNVGLMLALVSGKLGWINRKVFAVVVSAIVVCACFTISPGLGGLALSSALWLWLLFKENRRPLAFFLLFLGVGLSAAFLCAAMIAPNHHATAPFHLHLPLIEYQIDPSSRVMTWMGAWETFVANPLTGRGLGQDACRITYFDLSGQNQVLTDAHNTFLNVAAEAGIFALAAIVMICLYFVRRLFPLKIDSKTDQLRVGLILAFVGAFIYQGISGSFEDARHLWVLIGLIAATGNAGSQPA
jgi:O-antigen ligase